MRRRGPSGRQVYWGVCVRLATLLWFACGALLAQQPAGAGTRTTTLPDSPQPKQPLNANPVQSRTARFVGYVTNRSIVFPDIATTARPLTPGEKFKLFVDQSISPAYVLAAGIDAGVGQARNIPRGYGQGWRAYGERFGAVMARSSSDSFFSSFVFASALRQDPRFFPQSRPTFWGSVKYSARRVFVTRTDRGNSAFNASGFFGPLASETLANIYLPKAEQTGAKTAERFGTDLAWKFAANMFKNYWPTFFTDMRLNRLKVIPDPETTPDQPKRP